MADRYKRKYLHDADLTEALQRADPEAFQELVRLYYPALLDYGARISGSKEWAEDCVQDVLSKCWQDPQRLKGVSYPKTYLLVSVRNCVLRKMEQQRKEVSFSYDPETPPLPGTGEASVEEQMILGQENEEMNQKIRQAVQMLSPRQQEVIYLRFFQGLSSEQIQETMGLKKQSVHNLLSEALSKLREKLS